jgi:CheY-like chemotaxis protein
VGPGDRLSGGYRVLIVDDNDLNRALAGTVLTRCTNPITAQITLIEADSLTAARTVVVGPGEQITMGYGLPAAIGAASTFSIQENRR